MQQSQDHSHPMRWMWYGMAVMFVLIGVAVVLGAVYRPTVQTTYPVTFPFGFGWVWGIIVILFFVWILSWIFRSIFWSWGWRSYRHRRWYGDDACQVVRQRYARGEITREQFEQMLSDLQQHAHSQ